MKPTTALQRPKPRERFDTEGARILIVDDSPIIRDCFHWILEDEHGWKVCGEAANGLEAVEKAVELHPDVVILDVYMPVMHGFDAAREIRKELPQTAILMVSSYDTRQAHEEARHVGARGFVVKSGEAPKLVEAVQTVLRGGTSF